VSVSEYDPVNPVIFNILRCRQVPKDFGERVPRQDESGLDPGDGMIYTRVE
jgi:hypothetical protein